MGSQIMPYMLFYTVGGHVRAAQYQTLPDVSVAYNEIREQYSPAWVSDDEDHVVMGEAPIEGLSSA
jgi:hypothetical protein